MELIYTDWVIFVGTLLILIYIYATWNYEYFKKRNIPFEKPVPIFGNMAKAMLRQEHLIFTIDRIYNDFFSSRYTGYFDFRKPIYLIRDPELIRQIAVKDFDHFVDRRTFVDSKADPLFGNNLFGLKGQKWRDMRSTLSPAFTGSKMKLMYSLVSDCAQQMSAHLLKESKSGPLILDMKDLFTRYTNDVIATSAFGIKVDSLADPENEFFKNGKIITDFSSVIFAFKLVGYQLSPKLMGILGVTIFNKESSFYLRDLVLDTMNIRQRDNIFRPDMINLLMQARKGTLTHEHQSDDKDAGFATVKESSVGKSTHKRAWTDDDLAAQAILFFAAGFDTTSTHLCFAAHELAVNPEVQKTLLEEIDEAKQHGTPTYDSIQNLKYLDMVISEALRKWPSVPTLERNCVKPYTIKDFDGSPKDVIDKDVAVFFPVFSIHRDPQYYSDPERFDPERFSEENKKNINPFTYMPFGVGPRNCIGSRFALMEAKAVLFHLLSEFTFEVCSKTSVPLELTKNAVLLKPENGFWLEMKPRQ